MNDSPDPPRIFANRVIRQLIDHSFGEDLIVDPDDFLTMRTAFRSSGGSWVSIGDGDTSHLDKLKNIVTAWGQMPGRKKHSDRIV